MTQLHEIHEMDVKSFVNALLLCSLNVVFMFGGTFLNCVVIVSLWRSPQLRKKLCYFVILILSFFDLAVVVVTHPVIILATICWYKETYPDAVKYTWELTSVLFGGFSNIALLTLNIERFLALTYPFFHQTAVTRKRITFFLAFFVLFIVAFSPVAYFYGKTVGNIMISVFFLSLLIVFIFLNYKMFIIARSKQHSDNKAVSSTTANSANQNRKDRKVNIKNSTCFVAVVCFFVCSSPQVIYSALRFTSTTEQPGREEWLFNLWSSTIFSFNSSFNCLIFFWRNSTLRHEGRKVVKIFGSRNSSPEV